MAKAIPRRRNGRIGLCKSTRRIPKGVIHVQATFNNTIVTVTYIRGRVVSWASAGTCGFKGTRRGTPFAAQTAAGNAIRTVVDQVSTVHVPSVSYLSIPLYPSSTYSHQPVLLQSSLYKIIR